MTMTNSEFRKAIAKARFVEVYVRATRDDGVYLQISKAKALDIASNFDNNIHFDAFAMNGGEVLRIG